VIAAELTVAGDVPVDLNVNVCVAAVFTGTLPKLSVVALKVNCGLGAGEGDDPPPQEGEQSAWNCASA
jgi:hypothetical protein